MIVMSFQICVSISQRYAVGNYVMGSLDVEGLLHLRVRSNVKVEQNRQRNQESYRGVYTMLALDSEL